MKQLFTLILLYFSTVLCYGQSKKADYNDVIYKILPSLSGGDVLIVEKIPSSNIADELQINYNGGNPINGTKSPNGVINFNKTFIIPLGATQLTFKIDNNSSNDYDVTISGGGGGSQIVVPPVTDYSKIHDSDDLNRALWAAFEMDAYLYYHHTATANIKKEELQKILSRYIDAKRLSNVYGGDYNKWKNTNPFVKDMEYAKLYPAPKGELYSGMGSAIGGMDVTKYVQAFADFLRDRIKQELTIAYLEKFKQTLEKNKEIRELLPKTWATFKDNDIFNLPSMGATYKDAFAADLASLPDNFIIYVKRHHFNSMINGNKNAFIVGSAMYSFINQMAKGDHPSTALHTIALQNPYDLTTPLTSTYIIAITDMLSQNLLAKTGDHWIELKTVEKLNPDIIRIFFALLYDKYPDLFEASHLSRKLSELADNSDINQRFNAIYNFVILAQNIDQRINEFKKMKETPGNSTAAERKEVALDFFLSNSDALTDLVKTTFSVVNRDDLYDEKYSMIISGLTDAIDIAKAVRSNNFPRATNATISLITTVVGSEKDNKWIKPLKNILAFTNDVVAAKTSDEIKAVIANYAEPVQSYKVIRKSYFSAALSAYPGLYCGTESNNQTKTKLFSNFTYGVTAPIGLAFGSGNSDRDSSSITAFLSILDIGAALSYRSENTTTDIPDKITLAQIFAPGVHFVYGIKNSPLALKVGYQYAPQLRDISTESITVEDASVWRLTAGISVDIPIYIFTSKH
ncbi:hypothetical protein EV142_10964 [Flavobacterium circumlabens]|nr:hypothetical protein [Flavobacterium circumlabens]TCN53081.1 hypothetical protein EV142_10964 [Flavobacterium circumlabens]